MGEYLTVPPILVVGLGGLAILALCLATIPWKRRG